MFFVFVVSQESSSPASLQPPASSQPFIQLLEQ